MIEYDIIVKHDKDQPLQRLIVQPGGDNFQEVVLARSLKQCVYKANDRVKQRGTSNKGVIEHVEQDIKHVNWARTRPMFVRVRFDDGRVVMCHPSQLKRTK